MVMKSAKDGVRFDVWIVMHGAPLQVVARQLGHSDTRMVEKHYGTWPRPMSPPQYAQRSFRLASRPIKMLSHSQNRSGRLPDEFRAAVEVTTAIDQPHSITSSGAGD
jgi:hypothetical protein